LIGFLRVARRAHVQNRLLIEKKTK
jgi:hypothetical protein